MHHPFQSQQVLRTQDAQHFDAQTVQRLAVASAEVRQGMVVDLLQGGQPLEAGVIGQQPLDLARRGDAPAVGVDPDGHQQARIPRGASGRTVPRRDGHVERTEVHAAGHLPNRPHRMVAVHQLLDVQDAELYLLAVNPAYARRRGRLLGRPAGRNGASHVKGQPQSRLNRACRLLLAMRAIHRTTPDCPADHSPLKLQYIYITPLIQVTFVFFHSFSGTSAKVARAFCP